ncbi:MAG: hypothetical protein ABI729_08685, partial [Chitinophagales bacterium]
MWQLPMVRLIITFVGIIIVSSCSSKQVKQPVAIKDSVPSIAVVPKEIFPVDSVIRSITCAVDPSQSFALYLPPSYSTDVKYPVIIFFDPHGDGSTLLSDVNRRISMDEKNISLAGFSGGAKVALSYASDQREISSVIYAGAAVALQNQNPTLALLGFAGVNDMNYTDLLTFDQSLAATNLTHYLIEWKGKHEWPDTTSFQNAFYWITFNSMRSHLKEPDEAIINEYKLQQENAILANSAPLAKVMLLNEALYFLKGISTTDTYSQQLATIEKNKTYQETTLEKHQVIQKEQALKQEYYNAFQQKD